MKVILILSFSFLAAASNFDNIRDIIKDPSVSKRCRSLITERNQKIQTKQKLAALLKRNDKLLEQVKKRQQVVTKKLEITRMSLENNLRLTKYRIKSMEENIVRKGCPGIAL
jgi:nitric oxide reductase activation protein